MSTININLHNVEKVTAEVAHSDQDSHWVDLSFQFKRGRQGQRPETFVLTAFFDDAHDADALAVALNSVNRPRVAGTTAELMQQLRDSVALCDAEEEASFYCQHGKLVTEHCHECR